MSMKYVKDNENPENSAKSKRIIFFFEPFVSRFEYNHLETDWLKFMLNIHSCSVDPESQNGPFEG